MPGALTERAEYVLRLGGDAGLPGYPTRNALREREDAYVRSDWKQACEQCDNERISALIEAGIDPNACDEHGQTALMNAATRGDVDVARLLIERVVDLDHHAKYGLTALMLAVVNGHAEIASMLIEAGADVSKRGSGAPGFAGKDALALAQQLGQDAIVGMLELAKRC